MHIDPTSYNITIRRAVYDGDHCYGASVREFPHLLDYADSHEEAYQLICESIETYIEDCLERGQAFSPPYEAPNTSSFSGRVTLRLTSSLHQILSSNADNEGVSLNHYISTALAYHSGRTSYMLSANANQQWVLATPPQRATKAHLRVIENTNYEQPKTANCG